jgi:DeoR/GlpR family transcriptional regulator of sugar metabolism
MRVLEHIRKGHEIEDRKVLKKIGGCTIDVLRKDIARLRQWGLVEVHRGRVRWALAPFEHTYFGNQLKSAVRAKQAMAVLAADKLHDVAGTMFLGPGSSVYFFAKEIAQPEEGFSDHIMTNSVPVIMALMTVESTISVDCVAGSLERAIAGLVGDQAVESLEDFHPQTAVLGASGISADGELYCRNPKEVSLLRKVLKVTTERVLLLCHSDKLDHIDARGFGTIPDLLTRGLEVILVTDDDVPVHMAKSITGSDPRAKERFTTAVATVPWRVRTKGRPVEPTDEADGPAPRGSPRRKAGATEGKHGLAAK